MSKEKNSNLKEVKDALYTKKQIIESEVFKNRKDLLNALIKENEKLTLSEVNNRIDNFMKGGVR